MIENQALPPLSRYLGVRWWLLMALIALISWLCLPPGRKLATRLLRAGEAERCADLLRTALLTTVDKEALSEIHEELASVELLLGHHELALQHQRESVQAAPHSIKAITRLSELYELFCRPTEAHEALAKAVDLFRSWKTNGKPEILDLTRRLEVLAPKDLPSIPKLKERFQDWFATHRRRLAWYERWYQRLEPAVAIHRELAEDYPNDFDNLEALSRLEGYAGNAREATLVLERMKVLRPDQKNVRELLAYRYQWNRKPEKVVSELRGLGLERADERRRILSAYVQAGQARAGLAEYSQTHPADSDPRELTLALIEILLEEGDPILARTLAEELAVARPTDNEVLEKKAELQFQTRQFGPAAETYLDLADKNPGQEKYTRWAIDALDAGQDPTGALAQMEKLHEKHPDDGSLVREVGIRNAQMSHFDKALPLLEKSVKAGTSDEVVLYHLALALGERGRPAEAVVIYDRLLALKGGQRSLPPAPAPDTGYPKAAAPPQTGPVARRVLAFYKKSEGEAPHKNRVHLWLELVLTHLGLVVDYRAVEEPLPTDDEMSVYRGVVTWFQNERMSSAEEFARWLARQPHAGRPIWVMERFGCLVDAALAQPIPIDALQSLYRAAGLRFGGRSTEDPVMIEVVHKDPRVEFERKLAYERDYFVELESVNPDNEVLLRLARKDHPDVKCDAVVVGPGGAFVLATYALFEDGERYQRQWRIDPFSIARKVFRLEGVPCPDPTTRVGARVAYTHVDGDGSDGLCRWKRPLTCSDAFVEHVLEKRTMPMTVSFIACLVDPHQHVGEGAVESARKIFAQPRVEPAHHSYSHPLDWTSDKVQLKVHGYQKMDLVREVVEARKVVAGAVCPPGREVKLLLWSGSCNPGRDALALAQGDGQLNFNGGDPRLDGNNASITNLSPWTRRVGGLTQYLTSGPNDFLLTERWTLPSLAYRNVMQTFTSTDGARRLSPINVYFHFYLLSEAGGTRALDEVLDWLEKQPVAHSWVSEYIETVRDFEQVKIEQEAPGSYRIRQFGTCRSVRFDEVDLGVDLEQSRGVLGFHRRDRTLWVHLAPGDDALVVLGEGAPTRPYVVTCTAAVSGLATEPSGVSVTMRGFGDQRLTLGGVAPGSRWALAIGKRPLGEARTATAEGRLDVPVVLGGGDTVVELRAEGGP